MRKFLAVPLILFAQSVWAEPFSECPADAILVQGAVPKAYSINLASGDYHVAAGYMQTNKRLNALGFNPIDQYLYGWDYGKSTVARIHADFSVEALEVRNNPGKNFYVGDVHPQTGDYYVYGRGSNSGLYKIGLNPDQPNYKNMQRIVDGSSLSIKVADIAISPIDGMAYALSKLGQFYRINLTDGSHEHLADLELSGTFGAAYFDSDGNFYVARNNDGHIFRIAVGSGSYEAEFQAHGPSSNINDGARCAIAPVVEVAENDFGDAPDSYGTMLSSDGARHHLSDLYLGSSVDGESDSSAYPLSDDENDTQNDEDGIQFATSVVEGKNAVIVVKSTGKGYLNGWFDIDANGVFDNNDQLLTDYQITSEKESVYVAIPDGASTGKTWARFRLSSDPGLAATGEATDGEVEDYALELQQQEVTVNHYPAVSGWTTLAFEDNWPLEGDFDMNDLVVYMRTSIAKKANGVTQVNISGEVAAVGAAYHNGFAVRLPGVSRDLVDHANVRYTINDQPVKWTPIEAGRKEAILMVTYNMWDYVGTGEHCQFYRTEDGCGSSIHMKFEAQIPMITPVDVELNGVLDPFLFATPGAWHGGHFVEAPGRGYEIHLKNQSPTEAFDASLFDREGDDASDADNGLYFQTDNGLPWVLEIGTRWEYPIEYHDIGHAYPLFSKYARSNGSDNAYWYDNQHTNYSYIFEN